MQDATENSPYPELVGEPLRLELTFTFTQDRVTELIVFGERISSVAIDKFGVVRKISKVDKVSLQQISNRIPLLKYRYRGTFPAVYVPTLDSDTSAVIYTQSGNMQGEPWLKNAKSCQTLYFADSLRRRKSSFLKQQYEQMMPEPLQYHPSVCGFYTICASFSSSNSDMNKLQEFTMSRFFHSVVITFNFSMFLMQVCRFYNVFVQLHTL